MDKTVLIVEDERAIVEILKFNLEREGYKTLEALDGETGLALARSGDPDLILLDVMLPKLNGFDICAALRRDGSAVPIIMLTAREEETDKVFGLEAGADDYMTKPFSMRELMARVKANMRRRNLDYTEKPAEGSLITAGALTVNPASFTVTKNGQAVDLTQKEYDLLAYLLNARGKVFTREELQTIADLAVRYDSYVIMDEVYEHIVYAPHEHVYMNSLPGMWERTISCSSLSKTYSVTGWRLGYAIAPKPIMDRIKQFHDFNTVGAPSPLMEAAVVGLEMPDSYYREFGAHYAHMKELFTSGLKNIGIPFTDPQGTYFVLADIGPYLKPGQTDVAFCEEMVQKVSVACVPGTSFFQEDVRNIVRLHFAKKDETLLAALDRLSGMKEKMK